jgi:hypothetical protein
MPRWAFLLCSGRVKPVRRIRSGLTHEEMAHMIGSPRGDGNPPHDRFEAEGIYPLGRLDSGDPQ